MLLQLPKTTQFKLIIHDPIISSKLQKCRLYFTTQKQMMIWCLKVLKFCF